MADTTTLLPGGLLNKDGTYGATSDDISNLNQYVWSGILLPTTQDEYKARLSLASIKPELTTLTNNLLTTYSTVKTHSQQFKDVTYPKIVAIAGDVYNFAAKAGGTPENPRTSYYASIISNVKALEVEYEKKPVNRANINKIVNTINVLCDAETKAIEKLVAGAKTCVSELQSYQTDCMTDKVNLGTSVQAINDKLAGTTGSIATLAADLEAKKAELKQYQDEYEQDVKIAATTVTYAWVWPVGMIIGVVIAGVYGDKAVRMKALVDSIRSLISDNTNQLAADRAVVADANCMKDDLAKVVELIGPAITTVQKMIGDWGAVAQDLGAVKDAVVSSEYLGDETLLDLDSAYVMDQWNKLKLAADKYRREAYITAPSVKTLSEASAVFAKAA